jgi:hypothetical protein
LDKGAAEKWNMLGKLGYGIGQMSHWGFGARFLLRCQSCIDI